MNHIEKRIYLDHNATTPVDAEVLEEMLPYFRDLFGNPSSVHWFGQEARRALDQARGRVAALLGAEPEEIVFTSGGTEADNLALLGAAEARSERGNHIITSSIEHPAVLNTCSYLEGRGFKVTYLPVDGFGLVNPEAVAAAVTDSTILISVMLANNDIGTLQPIAKIAEIGRAGDVLVHTDAVQAPGRIPLDVRELGVDLLSISSHKIYGPKGVGALYVRRGVKLSPLIHGGHHEGRRRAGTENVPGIVGFGKACEKAGAELPRNAPLLASLRDGLQEMILAGFEHVRLNGHPEERLPNTLNVSFAFVEGEALLMNLDLAGVAVATGSACSSGTQEPSHVLKAIGCSTEEAHSSIRFSLGKENTLAEMNTVFKALVEIVDRLRAMSPLYRDLKAGIRRERS
jgi:cysteine desulfurase